MKKYIFLFGLAIIFLAGCNLKLPAGGGNGQQGEELQAGKICQEEEVKIPNIGGKGRRLANCFVEYPPVAMREDKSYYINEEICGQFTKDFMENITGQKIDHTEETDKMNDFSCSYFFRDLEGVNLNLEYKDINSQKEADEKRAARYNKNYSIPKNNLVLWDDKDQIMMIYFILSDYKYLRLMITPGNLMTSQEFLDLATRLGSVIKDYK